MKTMQLGPTGIEVSAIGLGAMHLSLANRPPEKQAVALIHRALDLGVTLIDTADSYCRDEGDKHHNEHLVHRALTTWDGDATGVVDGDTIRVLIDGTEYRVRYIGIDTPEIHPTHGVEPFGPEASQANSDLVEGKTVWLEKDVSETDRYGRLLRYVYVDDLMVNEELLRRGLAKVVTFPPDVKYIDCFLEIQRAAQEAEVGMWGVKLTPTPASSSSPVAEAWGHTHQQPDGNRRVPGKGALPGVEHLDIPLEGQPQWLVAAPVSEGSVWVAVLADGRVQAFHVVGRGVTPVATEPDQFGHSGLA